MKIIQSTDLIWHVATKYVRKNKRHSDTSQVVVSHVSLNKSKTEISKCIQWCDNMDDLLKQISL